MLKRIYLNLEIIGYSRAIGAMTTQPGVTAEHMAGLYIGREDAMKRLADLKAEQKPGNNTDNNISSTPANA